jgi:sugar lactone lactonase YvrE
MKAYPHPVPAGTMKLLHVPGRNPEDVILDGQGRVLCGLEDGGIVRMNADGTEARELLNTGGRPLGLDWLPDGRLLVCDCLRGLLAIDLDGGAIEVLLDAVFGRKMMVCNNPSVARDGTIYFSDSSQRYPLTQIRRELIEHVATGRLLRRKPNGEVDVLVDSLQFANGVVLAPDESFVLVAETGARRVLRVWLKGPRSGHSEVFADDLPGMPDNLSLGSDGLFWVALPSATDPRLGLLHRLPHPVRRLAGRVPDGLQPPELRSVLMMAFDHRGACARLVEGDTLRFHLVTGVREHEGLLYASSVAENAVAVFALPQVEPAPRMSSALRPTEPRWRRGRAR